MSYLFVDGGYLQSRLDDWARRFTGGDAFDVDYGMLFANQAEKVFVYDALPEKKDREDDGAYARRLDAAEARP